MIKTMIIDSITQSLKNQISKNKKCFHEQDEINLSQQNIIVSKYRVSIYCSSQLDWTWGIWPSSLP